VKTNCDDLELVWPGKSVYQPPRMVVAENAAGVARFHWRRKPLYSIRLRVYSKLVDRPLEPALPTAIVLKSQYGGLG
jgi:hypothetical protein